MSGAASYHAGLSAEAAVAAHYAERGLTIAARRWRGSAGEIDLVARDGEALIFIEVKKSRDFSRAAERLSSRQIARICAAASEFVAREPKGQLTEMRLDLAMVDGAGRVRVLENVSLH